MKSQSSSYFEKYEEQCKEVIHYIIEYLIYGDKHDSAIFDLFCEYNVMNEFILLSNLNNQGINLQIIKSFSMLILNLTNTTTLYFLFSQNFINQIISNDYEKYDEDFLSYYVNFIKSLSLKIDNDTIQFFYNEQTNTFPLLHAALKMYNYTDPMIKNVVRNIILTIMKLKYLPVIDYFSTLPCITYFSFISCRLRDSVIMLNDEIASDDQQKLKIIHDDIFDDVLYIQDILSLKLDKINYILTNCLFYYLILPVICGSLISMTKPRIAISASLYMLLLFFHLIKDESFINVLFSIIFTERLSKKIVRYMVEPSGSLHNYSFEWNAQNNSNLNSNSNSTTSNSFHYFIMSNFSPQFIKSTISMKLSPYPQIQAIVKKYDTIRDNNTQGSSSSNFNSLVEDILANFSNEEMEMMINYHKMLSLASGLNVGLCYTDIKRDSVMKIMERFYSKLTSAGDGERFFTNEVRLNLYSYLKSKDDTLILLVSLLISAAHRKKVAKELLSKASLLKANDFPKSDYDTNRILTELFSDHSVEKSSTREIEGNTAVSKKALIEMNSISNVVDINSAYCSVGTSDTSPFHNNFDSIFFSNLFSVEQKFYDSTLVESLINLLSVEPPLRTITNRLILENLRSLTVKEDNLSFIERNHIEHINKTYDTVVSNIKIMIMSNKYIQETGYEHFESMWQNYRKDQINIIDELVSKPYLLIPFNLEDTIEDYPECLRIQKTELECFKKNLILFMTIHDLRKSIYRETDLIRNSFPLRLGELELEVEQTYNFYMKLWLIDAGMEMYYCQLKSHLISNFTLYAMIVDQSNLYFALSDEVNRNFFHIRYKYALRHVEAKIDRSDPRMLILLVADQGKYLELAVFFENASIALQVQNNLEEHKKICRSTEYLLLDSYFDDLSCNWKF